MSGLNWCISSRYTGHFTEQLWQNGQLRGCSIIKPPVPYFRSFFWCVKPVCTWFAFAHIPAIFTGHKESIVRVWFTYHHSFPSAEWAALEISHVLPSLCTEGSTFRRAVRRTHRSEQKDIPLLHSSFFLLAFSASS